MSDTLMTEDTNRVFWRCLFEISGLPHDPQVPCPHPSKPDLSIAVGWPNLQLGLAYDADPKTVAAFQKAGWVVHAFPAEAMNRALPFLELLHSIGLDRQVRASSAAAVRNTSRDEDVLLTAVLKAGLPEPDRNHTITTPAGQAGTPDMVWAPQQLAVFVDGLFHHRGRDRLDIIKAAADDPDVAKHLAAAENTRATKDAALRRHMTTHGWVVIEVTDQELSTPDGVAEIAAEIAVAYRHGR